MADIVLINPRFEVSFWGMEHALPFLGKKANLPVACMPLLAALTPSEHTVRLIDENVEPIDFEACARADIVGITGMSVQRFRMREILEELKRRKCFTVVGGPWVTVQEDYFDESADVIFIGEAEQTWPRFLEEWRDGRHGVRYEQDEKTDMTTVPAPRLDLLQMKSYAFGSLQISRGCPFQCEFCDIIVTFGRKPRIKTSDQLIAELNGIVDAGMRTAFIVDDNLIGNKKVIKELLTDMVAWQRSRGYPISIFTEASIDLADEPELLALMVEANFVSVFIGIESPNEESLRETKKFQNIRDGGTLVEKVHRIQDAGIEVWCGMIMGFDHDDLDIFDRQVEFIQQARISFSMSGMLAAIPKTPLYDRLQREGRLDYADPPEFGTNVIPKLMSSEELRDGYLKVLQDLYEPERYFARTEALFLRKGFALGYAAVPMSRWGRRPWRWYLLQGGYAVASFLLMLRLMLNVTDRDLRREYRTRFWRFLKIHRHPGMLHNYLLHMAMHYHAQRMTKEMTADERQFVNTF